MTPWIFARLDGVRPPTPRVGARPAAGGAVAQGQFRFGQHAGSQFVERLLTVVAACRQQGRPLLDFLVAADEAALRSSTPPSLLPAAQGLNDYRLCCQTARLTARSRNPADAPDAPLSRATFLYRA